MKLSLYLSICPNTHLKWIKHLINVKPETLKFLEKNIGKYTLLNKQRRKFSEKMHNDTRNNPKNWQMKLGIFYTINNHQYQGTVYRIYQLYITQAVSTQHINHLINKWHNELNREFSKEEMQMVNKYLKRVQQPQPLKMQMRTPLRFVHPSKNDYHPGK